jgi:hypothetical protein
MQLACRVSPLLTFVLETNWCLVCIQLAMLPSAYKSFLFPVTVLLASIQLSPCNNNTNPVLMLMYVLCRSAFSLGLDADLPPMQGSSSQAFGDSLQQRYFPPVHSAPTSSLFTHAAPPGPLFRQGWGAVDHGGQHTQQGGLTHLLPHNSAPPHLWWGDGVFSSPATAKFVPVGSRRSTTI